MTARLLWLVPLAVLLLPSSVYAQQVRLWHAYREGGDEQQALNEVIELYRQTKPSVQVEMLALPFESYNDKLSKAVPLGNGPDLFLDAHERIGDYRKAGVITTVTQALPDADVQQYSQGAIEAITEDGQRWGIPVSRKCLALYLNNALVKSDPTRFEDLVQLKATLPAGVFPLAHSAGSAYAHHPFLTGFGGEFVHANDTFGLDTPEAAKSVDYVNELLRTKIIPEEASGALVSELFSSGKAAAAIGGPWLAGDLKTGVPYRVVPLPVLEQTGKVMRPLLTVETVLLTPQGAKRPEVIELARFLGGNEATKVRARVGKMVSARVRKPGEKDEDPFLSAFERASDLAVPMRSSMRLVFEPVDRALRKAQRGDALSNVALQEAKKRFEDVKRPLPPPASSTAYSLFFGALSMLGAGYWYYRAKKDQTVGGPTLKGSLPAFAYVSLATLAVVVLVVVPLTVGAASSLFAGRGDQMRFVGFSHYWSILTARGGELLGSGSFYAVLLVTLLWTVANITLHVFLGGSLGLILSSTHVKFRSIFRILLIVPWALPSYVTALAWKGMFHRQFGAVNATLALFGVDPVSWFARFSTAFSANLATNVWLGFPFFVVVTLGAVTAVPTEVIEAAEIDGASRWQILRQITLPIIRPIMMPSIALGSVWTFNMFNVVFLVSGGDPDGTTDILVSEAYRWAFTRDAQMGYAAAYAVLIFLLLFGSSKLSEKLKARYA